MHDNNKIQNINRYQQQTIDSLNRTLITIQTTRDIGDETVSLLAMQTEQTNRINNQLENLDTEVTRGKSELWAFTRRMMADKIILCFLILIVICAIVIIVLKVK